MASSAVFTAVSKPNVVTVPLTSLSIVFGTQTIFIPSRRVGARCPASRRPDRDERVDAEAPCILHQLVGAILFLIRAVGLLSRIEERVAAVRRPQDRTAMCAMPRTDSFVSVMTSSSP
jgi:hypothetical protein